MATKLAMIASGRNRTEVAKLWFERYPSAKKGTSFVALRTKKKIAVVPTNVILARPCDNA
jgi:hypothetical protein